ncbi:acyltransferase [Actinomadura miaoliensis]|uniref:Acyltransferase 3 domain-containing protein n=1 Tax=Actinomadura miaoliensis TaxID=430685 RepID=A0ABP7WP72_9ACTN
MSPPSPVSSSDARLGWLDALRGWAAMLVALHHASYVFVPDLQASLAGRWDPGHYGVLVFFLVSGYIVPASLERHGSVRAFWTGRAFRLYPLLAVACLLGVLPFLLNVRGLRAGLEEFDPVTAILAHATMLQDLLAVPNAINVLWTLSYEMAFYLLIVALWVVGGQRRSAPVAVGLALLALPAGALLPTALLSRTAGTGPVVVVAATVLVVAVAAAMSEHRGLRTAGGLLGGLLAVTLVAANGRVEPWEGAVMLAVMFAGTAVYRAEHGQVPRRATALALGAVLAASLAAVAWNPRLGTTGAQAWQAQWVWGSSLLLAAATFGAAWLLRRRRFPRWATGLGTASFSVYLLHPILLMVSAQFLGRGGRQDTPGLVVFVVVLVAVSWASHRWIEAPAQRAGRRLSGRAVRARAAGGAGVVAVPAPPR